MCSLCTILKCFFEFEAQSAVEDHLNHSLISILKCAVQPLVKAKDNQIMRFCVCYLFFLKNASTYSA